MNKLWISLVLLIAVLPLQAQSFSLGAKAGINISSQAFTESNFDAKSRVGFQVGVASKIAFSELIAVQPSIMLIQKGYSYSESTFLGDVRVNSMPLYINIPIPVVVNYDLGSVGIFGGLGPYMGFGVGGNVNVDGDVVGFNFADEGKINWGNNSNDTYKPLDAGLVFTAGVNIDEAMQVGLGYELGLADLDTSGNDNVYNRSFTINFAYFFITP